MKKVILIIGILCLLSYGVFAATLMSDDFNANTSANYSRNTPTTDYDATWNFDYSTVSVPVAPRTSDATTKGLRLFVNHTAATTGALNVYTNTTFSGNYRVTLDVYGRFVGTSGTTNSILIGINHSGSKNCNMWQDGTATLPVDTDGYYLSTTIDGGYGTSDYVCNEGAATGSPDPLTGLTWANSTVGTAAIANTDALFTTLFPSTTPAGSFGNQWVTVKIEYISGVMTLYFNNTKIWDYNDADDTFTSGKLLLGFEDDYASSMNVDNMVIFDNLLVETATTSEANWPLY